VPITAELPHPLEHLPETHLVGIEHRTAAGTREAVAGEVHDVDIAGARRDALLQNSGPLVYQRVHQPIDDLDVAHRARDHAELCPVLGNQVVCRRRRDGAPRAVGVVVPSAAGLLTQATQGAELVGQGGVDVGRAHGATVAPDREAHVVSHQVADPERTHGEAERLDRPVHLLRRRALLHQVPGLLGIAFEHAVADESVAHPRDHGHLAEHLAEAERGGQHVGGGGAAPHHLQQPHHVGGAEEVEADHIRRPAGEGGDRVDIQGGGVGREEGARLHCLVEREEDLALDLHGLEHGLDRHVGLAQAPEREGRPEAREPAMSLVAGELALLHLPIVDAGDALSAALERGLVGLY
jgi:hypothetical protein